VSYFPWPEKNEADILNDWVRKVLFRRAFLIGLSWRWKTGTWDREMKPFSWDILILPRYLELGYHFLPGVRDFTFVNDELRKV
jgi:hypothetical protein